MIRFDAGTLKELKDNIKKTPVYKTVGSHDHWKIQAVKDLVDAKFDHDILPNFTTNEIDDLRDYLSTC